MDDMIPLKCCSKCKTDFPASLEFFRKHSRGGLRPRCRKCDREDSTVYNHAHVKDHNQYYQVNKDAISEKNKRHRKAHREEINARRKQRYQLHHERALAWARAGWQKRYMQKCAVEGTLNAQQIRDKLKNQRYTCYYCRDKLERRKDGTYIYHLDHTVPISRPESGPRHDVNFIVLTCPTCNLRKKDKLPSEWPEGGRLL